MSFELEVIIKLFLGFILAGIIGAEREALNKPAGFKTHSLIGISAVLIMLCGEYLSVKFGSDASRIPAQLLSGIGFIGAGTILTDGFNVKGLTTAASLLTVTCIGLSIGAGFYLGGIICTVVIYLILSYSHKMVGKLDHFNTIEFNILSTNKEGILNDVEAILDNHKIIIKKIKSNTAEDKSQKFTRILCKYKSSISISKILSEISLLDNIIEVEGE